MTLSEVEIIYNPYEGLKLKIFCEFVFATSVEIIYNPYEGLKRRIKAC
ncbi:hypothetical protein L8106_25385 [Lyngbya sp. PCC 8106]|nr:hypothetical protein L8106_25385 [Lyngbya sp. PCC 8106]